MLKRWSLIPAVALALLAGACGTDAEASGSSEEVCAEPQAARDETVTMEFDGMERSYIVVAPESAEPLPVVLDYHAFTKTAKEHRAITGLADAAIERGFVAVFPQGTTPEDGWRPYFNIGTNDDEGLADDLGFTAAILDQLEGEHCIDPARVYATGWSNGGLFVSTLACEMQGRIAAVAAVSGVFLLDDCPDEAMPMMILHGTADSYAPYEGGTPDEMAEAAKRLGATPAQEAMFRGVVLHPIDYIDSWLEHNGCQDPPVVTEEEPRLEVSEYQDCGVDTVILEAGPHRWQPYPTARILEFFFGHELSAG